jgi:hypothetical protein
MNDHIIDIFGSKDITHETPLIILNTNNFIPIGNHNNKYILKIDIDSIHKQYKNKYSFIKYFRPAYYISITTKNYDNCKIILVNDKIFPFTNDYKYLGNSLWKAKPYNNKLTSLGCILSETKPTYYLPLFPKKYLFKNDKKITNNSFNNIYNNIFCNSENYIFDKYMLDIHKNKFINYDNDNDDMYYSNINKINNNQNNNQNNNDNNNQNNNQNDNDNSKIILTNTLNPWFNDINNDSHNNNDIYYDMNNNDNDNNNNDIKYDIDYDNDELLKNDSYIDNKNMIIIIMCIILLYIIYKYR